MLHPFNLPSLNTDARSCFCFCTTNSFVMASYKLLFLLFFSTGFLNSATPGVAVPTYVAHKCATDKNFIEGDPYQSDLKDLLDFLSSCASGKTVFFNASETVSFGSYLPRNNDTLISSVVHTSKGDPSETIYGLFMCSGYVTLQLCHQCVHNAITQLSFNYCKHSKEAIIWYDECMVRYSNLSFFSTVDTNPSFSQVNSASFNITDSDSYNKLFMDTMNAMTGEAAKPALEEEKYATKQANISRSQSLYCAAQCTPDLSPKDCRFCLSYAISYITLNAERRGGRMLYPSCNIRYESYPFYVVAPAPSGDKTRKIILVVIPIVVLSGILFCLACYFLQKKKRKSYKTVLEENFGTESTAFLESLQFSLATIEAATNKFSQENKIGKGGFGEVYKGILLDGREIAIKRLSKNSGQGALEFKNEVLLMAKLQHRNLVTLLGFCLEGQEKILIYEYVPNNSLDYFLFGTQMKSTLNWPERYKIIEGIAQGILYLHKYSRLKIIHRDLKPSNILLDNNMNPKISDFGISRMVGIDETQGSTNKIVGTYGYMSPEYALFGEFSEKSDVFSFGVIVLEIISGKRNTRRPDSQCVDSLLSYAWKQWRNESALKILDPSMGEVDSQNEVIKCIHIGLLCGQEKADARPTMITVVQYLNNDSIELPSPKEPAFFTHDRMEPLNIEASDESGSINVMSTSKFFPR